MIPRQRLFFYSVVLIEKTDNKNLKKEDRQTELYCSVRKKSPDPLTWSIIILIKKKKKKKKGKLLFILYSPSSSSFPFPPLNLAFLSLPPSSPSPSPSPSSILFYSIILQLTLPLSFNSYFSLFSIILVSWFRVCPPRIN